MTIEVVDDREWHAADYEADRDNPATNARYAMGRKNYPAGDYKYLGCAKLRRTTS